jgi:signal peptidase I
MDASLSPRELVKNELAAEVIRRFGTLRLRVTGSSMVPTVHPGDLVLISHCAAEQANPGDVILFMRHRRLFAHRVVSLDGPALVTQGDSVAHPDPRVMPHELLGKVTRVTRHEKIVSQPSKLTLQAQMAVAVFRRSAMAVRFFCRLQALRTGI